MGAAEDQSLACAYASLILHDGGKPISAASIDKMLTAAGCKAGFDGCLFEKALANADVKGLIDAASKVGGGGGGGRGEGCPPSRGGGGGHGFLALRLRLRLGMNT